MTPPTGEGSGKCSVMSSHHRILQKSRKEGTGPPQRRLAANGSVSEVGVTQYETRPRFATPRSPREWRHPPWEGVVRLKETIS